MKQHKSSKNTRTRPFGLSPTSGGRLSAVRSWLTGAGVVLRGNGSSWLVLALGSGMIAQWLLDQGRSFSLAGGLYAGAAVLFVLLMRRGSLSSALGQDRAVRWGIPWPSVLIAAALGAIAFPRFTGNLFHRGATWIWISGLGMLLLGVYLADSRDGKAPSLNLRDRVSADGINIAWWHVALLAIIALGAFFRLHRIAEIPAEMGCDLPHVYSNIRYILRGEYLIFFPSYPGREGLFFYLAAPLCKVLGLTHTNIKAAAGLVGVVTLPVVYLLGKELFNREVGLWAALLLSISHWHIIQTRIGFRACTVPLVLSLTWLFFARGLRTGRRWPMALAGLFLGIGLYSYNAHMIVPVMIVAMFLGTLLTQSRKTVGPNLGNMVILVVVAIYVFIPLARYAYEQPESYIFRAATRITDLETSVNGSPWLILLDNVRKTLLMFNLVGDGVSISNVPFLRQLGFFSAILLVLGLAWTIWHWREGLNLTVLISWAIMLLPTALSIAFPAEVPNAIRAMGAVPAVVVLCAISLTLVRRTFAQAFPRQPSRQVVLCLSRDGDEQVVLRWRWGLGVRHGLVAMLILALAFETWSVYPTYFDDYRLGLPEQNYSVTLEMARAIDAFVDEGEAYIKIMPYWYDGNAVRAQLRHADQSWHNEIGSFEANHPPLAGDPGKFMVIIHPGDQQSLAVLNQFYPSGISLTRRTPSGQVAFLEFYGER